MFVVDEDDLSIDQLEEVNFSKIGWTEPDQLEELVAENLESFIQANHEEENLLLIGRQVRDETKGKNDLVAIDGSGNIVLIEIKRDKDDMEKRREKIEHQAIRYAAALARIDSAEELLSKIYVNYVATYEDVDEPEKVARNRLYGFLRENNVDLGDVNPNQRIILFASGYDERSLSSLAWLAANGIDITVLRGDLYRYQDQLMLDIEQLLPTPKEEAYFIDIEERSLDPKETSTSTNRRQKPRLRDLIEAGKVDSGDRLRIPAAEDDDQTARATLIDHRTVEVGGEEVSPNQWAKGALGWTSVSIYRQLEHMESGMTLGELRDTL